MFTNVFTCRHGDWLSGREFFLVSLVLAEVIYFKLGTTFSFHILCNSLIIRSFRAIFRRELLTGLPNMTDLLLSKLRYSPEWALASYTTRLQASRFLALSLHPLTPIFLSSMDTSSSHLILVFLNMTHINTNRHGVTGCLI